MASAGKDGFLASSFMDLMASLAVIFILLTVMFIRQAAQRTERGKEAVRQGLGEVLRKNDLPLAEDPKDPLVLSVTMREELLRFPLNSASISGEGRAFLDSFVPGLTKQLCSEPVRSKIDSVSIEGHTDRAGEGAAEGARRNFKLSQDRSFAVLDRAIESVHTDHALSDCLLALASASGRGSRDPVVVDGVYDPDRSRRVEIKIRLKSSEQQVISALGASNGNGNGSQTQ